jgi:hypothetical protein
MISTRHAIQARPGAAAQRRHQAAVTGSPKRLIVSGAAAGHVVLRRVRAVKHPAAMATVAGLWIDRRKAVIAVISAAGEALTEIHSDVERAGSRSGGVQSTASYESQLVKADDRRQRAFSGHISRFYDRVLAAVDGTESVFICGPGEAKGEFRKHLEKAGPGERCIAVEAAAGLSTRQLMAKIRAHFRC